MQFSALQTRASNLNENYTMVLTKKDNIAEAGKRYPFANSYPLVTRNGDNHHISNTEPRPVHYLLGKNFTGCFTSTVTFLMLCREVVPGK